MNIEIVELLKFLNDEFKNCETKKELQLISRIMGFVQEKVKEIDENMVKQYKEVSNARI